MKKNTPYITGILEYSLRKIILRSKEETYFVRPRSVRDGYVHGDLVRAQISKRGTGGRMAEVEVSELIHRSREAILMTPVVRRSGVVLQALREYGHLEIPYSASPLSEGAIVSVTLTPESQVRSLRPFGQTSDYDIEEKVLLSIAKVRDTFPDRVIKEAENIRHDRRSLEGRRDFRDTFVITIDGADAKDLDDAISVKKLDNGDYELAVHIADVAEYVREGSELDREAKSRATSIYTPGKVIPMLPEALSNDLCSLHPGSPKLTLSCIMTLDRHGQAKHTEIVEGVIESAHRGVYDDIWERYQCLVSRDDGKNSDHLSGIFGLNNIQSGNDDSKKGGLGGRTVGAKGKHVDGGAKPTSFLTPSAFGTFGNKSTDILSQELDKTILTAFELYDILKTRREKEGKILFESTELYFDFDPSQEGPKTPVSVRTRARNPAHMLIEEFMVLTNEEVAKWCHQRRIPFLSRVHGLPGNDQKEIIEAIIGGSTPRDRFAKRSDKKDDITPDRIRTFLAGLTDPDDLYRYSRLLLPRMAKAFYMDKPSMHFGLALEYYAHFTSPIRRYPDLQIHRIIKETLQHQGLPPARRYHYEKILGSVARHSSEQERSAEDIERVMDDLYACRYIVDKVGTRYQGRISGIAEFAYFVEIESGIEVTVMLPRGRYQVGLTDGILRTATGKKITEIGERLEVRIDSVKMDERRILAEKI